MTILLRRLLRDSPTPTRSVNRVGVGCPFLAVPLWYGQPLEYVNPVGPSTSFAADDPSQTAPEPLHPTLDIPPEPRTRGPLLVKPTAGGEEALKTLLRGTQTATGLELIA